MNRNDGDMLVSDIEKMLKDYFGLSDILEIMKQLDTFISIPQNNPYKSEACCSTGVDYSDASIHREVINSIIPFAAKRISQTDLVKLMGEISRITILHGEFNIAAEINEEIILRTAGSDVLAIARAQAYLDLAKISQCQAFWSESIDFVKQKL